MSRTLRWRSVSIALISLLLSLGGVLSSAHVAWPQEVDLSGTWFDQDKYHFGGLWTKNYFDDLDSNGRYDPGEPWDDLLHVGWTLASDNSCWAASAANMLRYVGGPDRYDAWVYQEGVDIGLPHRSFWTEGGYQHEAIKNDGYAANLVEPSWVGSVYKWTFDPTAWVEQRLAEELPIGIGVFWPNGAHAVTVYAIDRTARTMTISDSDGDDGGVDFSTYTYTWDSVTGVWSFAGYIAGSTIHQTSTFATNDFIGDGAGGLGSDWSRPANWSAGHAPSPVELPKIHFAGLGAVNLNHSAVTLKTILRGQTKLTVAAGGLLRAQTIYAGDAAQVWVDRGVLQVMKEALNDGLLLVLPGAYVEADWMRIGSRDYGAIVQSGGDFSTTTNGRLSLGEQPGVEGAYQVLAGRVFAAQLEVGRSGIGTFHHGGGQVLAPIHLYVGDLPGSVGTFNLSGATSTLQAATEFIGREGTGTFNHYDGSNQCDGALWIGHYDHSHGEYYLHAGTLAATDIEVGGYLDAYGFFQQLGGACLVERDLNLAQFSRWSHGSYQLDDGVLRVGRNVIVGAAGTAAFYHNGGLHEIAGNLVLGAAENSYGAYVLQGGTLDVAHGTVTVGWEGDGVLQLWGGTAVASQLDIRPSGLVQIESSGNLHADLIDLSGGSLITTGPNSTIRTNGINGLGSTLTINGNLGVGWSGGSGVGYLAIGAGQSLGVSSVLYLGEQSTGTLAVAAGGRAQIGQARVGDHGSGALNVNGGATVVNQNGNFYFGYYGAGATGALTIDGGAAVLANEASAFLGVNAGTNGTALVTGPGSRWRGLGNLYVGGNTVGPQGAGRLTVASGGRVDVNSRIQVWNTGRVELLGGSITAATFHVDVGGAFVHHDGTLTVDGQSFHPGTTYNYSVDSPAPNQRPSVVLRNGATSTIPNTLFIGFNHAGELRLESGAVLQSFNGRVGWNAGTSDGRVVVDGAGSRWVNAADLEIGVRNSGEMLISGGGAVENTVGAIGAVPGSSGRVTVSTGGRWTNTDALFVGGKFDPGGAGVLTVDGAEVAAASVTVWPQGSISLVGANLDAGSVDLAGGALEGAGTLRLAGQFVNEGRLAPGAPVGLLAARGGDYLQTAAGALAIEIASTRVFDRLTLDGGNATLAGALAVSLVGEYVPSVESQFEILSAENRVFGAFDPLQTTFPLLGGGLGWHVEYRAKSVVLQVVQAAFAGADFDENGVVNGADLSRWKANFGLSDGAAHAQGDADGDHDVDGQDFLLWQKQLSGQQAAVGLAAGSYADARGAGHGGAPEPGGCEMAFIALALLALRPARWANAPRFGANRRT